MSARLTKEDRRFIAAALNWAYEWEESYLDCTIHDHMGREREPKGNDIQIVATTRDNMKRIREMQKKLRG